MDKLFLGIAFLLFSSAISAQQIDSEYLVIAHSHNDYEQTFPVTTALENKFTSIEVDIVYSNNTIRVCHDIDDVEGKPDFQYEYLPFLFKEIERQGQNVILLIDIKNYSPGLMVHLDSVLKTYEHLLLRRDGKFTEGSVQVLLSGDIPRSEISANTDIEFFFLDGRIEDLDNASDLSYTPIISMNFTKLVDWNAQERPDKNTIAKISQVVDRVHQQGKKIRFWKTSDNALMWLTLMGLEVDIIGVDNLKLFSETMKKCNLLK